MNNLDKYSMTIKEAASYFGIGENRLRAIISNNYNADFILRVGNRTKIKVKLFEKWLDNVCDL